MKPINPWLKVLAVFVAGIILSVISVAFGKYEEGEMLENMIYVMVFYVFLKVN